MEKEYYIIKIIKLNMKGILLKINVKDMENLIMKMVNIILDNFPIIKEMVKGNYIQKIIILNLKGILLMGKL